MSDLADLAQVEENQDRDAAIMAALMPPPGCEDGPFWVQGVPYCRHCETEIPERRLQAVPGTGLCVECASQIQEAFAMHRETTQSQAYQLSATLMTAKLPA